MQGYLSSIPACITGTNPKGGVTISALAEKYPEELNHLMKKAQEMQNKMAEMQDGLQNFTVTGQSGAGLVKATATAKGELTALEIDPSIFSGDDKEVVEDLILAAVKDAQIKATEKAQEEMGKLTEGLGLPAGMKLPF